MEFGDGTTPDRASGAQEEAAAKLEFDAATVFGTSKDDELKIDLDAAHYNARQGVATAGHEAPLCGGRTRSWRRSAG